MHQVFTTTVMALSLSTSTNAFVTNPTATLPTTRATNFAIGNAISPIPHTARTRLYNSEDDDAQDSEIERLKRMAAKLRSEAAALEADKAQQLADAAEKAFRKFDIDSDGEVSLIELKTGLEKELKTDISEKRVKELMDVFDKSGDGALQLDEFVTVDRFRNQLESLAREEKRLAVEAEIEAKIQKEKAIIAEAKLNFFNEKEPTMTDKVVSVLPYLFPLMDGLQYGRFLLGSEEAGSNPFLVAVAVLYTLYRSIPFSGFVAFFALNTLSSNTQINRLVRFNMQQAIFIDIALFFPSLLIGLGGLVLGNVGTGVTEMAGEIFSDVMFGSLILLLTYCAGSSLLGKEPNNIPILSEAVLDRMPTIDMFDDDGMYLPREQREKDDKKSDKDEKK